MKRLALAALLLASTAFGAEPTIEDFFESFSLEWTRGDPQAATFLQTFQGTEQDTLDRQLTPLTDEYRDSRVLLAKRGLAELRRFDRAKLTARQRLHAEMLDWQLDSTIRGNAYRNTRFPFDQFNGVQLSLVDFFTKYHPMRNPRDAENYLARLAQLGPRLDEACIVARARVAAGSIPPRFILNATIAQLDRLLSPATQNILVSSFAERAAKIPGLSAAEQARLVTAAEQLTEKSVLPAFRQVVSLLHDLLPRSTDDAGLWRLPDGDAAYAFALRSQTSVELSPEQVHNIGLREVARLEKEMDILLRKLGLTEGSVAARMKQLDGQSFYPNDPDTRTKILADYDRWIRDAEKRCEAMFDLRPKFPVIVNRESEFSEKNGSANYTEPARDGSRPGIFRVPLPGPKFPHECSMRSTTYHETVPGHHFQLALQQEMTDLPRFIRDGTFGSGTTAYIEGWALYAEYLAIESGWYEDDPRGLLGALDQQCYRARRLVVDTGLHFKHWTKQQAMDYGFSEAAIERYVVWPGQACAYMLGELKILELREKARKALGEKFSFKEFHNVVLRTGAVPLPILERVVDDYISGAR